MSRRSKGRAVHGILLLDKPVGITSNQALMEVKRLYDANKAGHTGSLDPLACGMLPICFGEATKFSQFLLEADKQYYVEAKLGVKTTTGDAEGEVVATQEPEGITISRLENVLDLFRGEISQIPSMYSAIKYQGKPLYTYARAGINVPRNSRTVHIKELRLLRYSENTLAISVQCSKGTYIRTLIEDIGDALKCGAHVSFLRRTLVEPYSEDSMLTLDQLKSEPSEILDQFLLPIDSALMGWPTLHVTDSIAYYIRQGQPVIIPRAPSSGWVKLTTLEDMFVGVGEILDDGRVAPRRLIAS